MKTRSGGLPRGPARERHGPNPWTAKDFYAVGKSDWAAFRLRLSDSGAHFGRAVEIGSGAGRLTEHHMALDFDEVIGVDVSPGMLKTARIHLTERNIELRLGDSLRLPVNTGSADVAFSTHVFQHFESYDVARSNFREIGRVLHPDGCMLIHLPTFQQPSHGMPGTGIRTSRLATSFLTCELRFVGNASARLCVRCSIRGLGC